MGVCITNVLRNWDIYVIISLTVNSGGGEKMGSLIVTIILVGVGVAIWVGICSEFGNIANLKGFDRSKYFWLTFFFGIIGMLMVIALPSDGGVCNSISRNIEKEKKGMLEKATNKMKAQSSNSNDVWICKNCSEKNSILSAQCKSCGTYK